MEPKCSLLCSQEPPTEPYPELLTDEFGPPSSLFLSGLPTKILYASLFFHVFYMPSHLIHFDEITLILRRVQVMRLLTVQIV